jgi:PAS domain S-box-containing protein
MIDAFDFVSVGKSDRQAVETNARQDMIRRYGFAVLVFAITLAIRLALTPVVGARPILVMFVAAVLFIVLTAGLGPAILAAGLVLIYDAVLKIQTDTFLQADIVNALAFFVFVLEVYWLNDRLGRLQTAATEAAESAERWEKYFQSFLNSVPDPAVIVDRNGSIQAVSLAAANLFGFPGRKLIGTNLGLLLGEEGGPDEAEAAIPAWLDPGQATSVKVRPQTGEAFMAQIKVADVWIGNELLSAVYLRGPSAPADAPAISRGAYLRLVPGGHRADPSRADPSRNDPSRNDPSRGDPSRGDLSRADPSGADPSDADPSKVLARMSQISTRESQVLSGLVDGKSNKSIGLALGISPRTVERHRANLMKKMSASSLSELVRMTVEARRLRGPAETHREPI